MRGKTELFLKKFLNLYNFFAEVIRTLYNREFDEEQEKLNREIESKMEEWEKLNEELTSAKNNLN